MKFKYGHNFEQLHCKHCDELIESREGKALTSDPVPAYHKHLIGSLKCIESELFEMHYAKDNKHLASWLHANGKLPNLKNVIKWEKQQMRTQ